MKRFTIQSILLSVALIFFNSCQDEENLAQPSIVLVQASVKIDVGGVLYENLDAHIQVKGYNAKNEIQWTSDYDFVGPTDVLEIRDGFHHYSIELVDKWGITNLQSNISLSDIRNGRADGPSPLTYVLGGEKAAKKLSSYITSREVSSGTGLVYMPELKVSLVYNDNDQVETIYYEMYNQETSRFEASKTESFIYVNNVLSKIITTLDDQLYSEDNYEYGIENKITETNYYIGIVAEQKTVTHPDLDPNHEAVSVSWVYSNGTSLEYDFNVQFENLVNDKTIKNGELCNEGTYTYDKAINPFRHLGYTDFMLQNWSANNRVSEDVDFIACGYPSLIPHFFYFTYDEDGYPVTKITKYNSSATPNVAYHSKVEFFYN